jgi:hypothetical protein
MTRKNTSRPSHLRLQILQLLMRTQRKTSLQSSRLRQLFDSRTHSLIHSQVHRDIAFDSAASFSHLDHNAPPANLVSKTSTELLASFSHKRAINLALLVATRKGNVCGHSFQTEYSLVKEVVCTLAVRQVQARVRSSRRSLANIVEAPT